MPNSAVFRGFRHTSFRTNPKVVAALQRGKIRGPMAYRGWWTQRVAVGDFTGDADGDQTLALHTLYPNNLFPEDVWLLPGHHIVPIVAFAGGTVNAVTAQGGDADDTDGLVTASSVFTGVTLLSPISTPGAAQYARRYEAAFAPTLRLLTTAGNVNALTAGALEVRILFEKHIEV